MAKHRAVDKDALVKRLKNRRMSMDEICYELKLDSPTAERLLRELQDDHIPLDVSTSKRGRKVLFHINVLPEDHNTFYVSDRERSTSHYKLGFTSDWHFGSKFHLPKTWHECMKRTRDAGIKKVYVAGDLMDGSGIYKGHLENLTEHGVEGQTDAVAEAISKYPELEFWGIAGNHDYSFTQQNGAKPLAILEAKADNFKNLGDMKADVVVKGVKIRLLHGAGGRAYATSYPSQTYLRDYFKGLERDELNEIPHILAIGHYHTLYHSKDHSVYVMQSGSFQDGDNEYCVRRGLTGPHGLHHVDLAIYDGQIVGFRQEYVQPRLQESGRAFAKTTRSYR